MSTVNYNADNYTITELLAILGLDEPDSIEIMNTTNSNIQRFSSQPQLVNFFKSIQTKLLTYMNELENTEKDAVQQDKNTDRKQKIDVYENEHVPMKREQLGVNNTYNVPVVQDTLNPNLKNITRRFINLDSQFRQASGGSESMSTDYTMDLSDPLTDVLSLCLYTIQIPYTWYTIDYVYGNTCFWVTNKGNTFKIILEPGNYTPSEFCTAINMAFTTSANFLPWTTGFTYASSPPPDIARFNSNNGKITLYLDKWTDPAGNQISTITQYSETFDSDEHAYFTFFDLTGTKSCYESGTHICSAASTQGHTFNGTLGWLMGFRLPLQPIFSSDYGTSTTPYTYSGGNTPSGVLNLYGTKYFIIVLDDYNQNHINNGLITITELSKRLPIPSYYNTSQNRVCANNESTLDINAIGNLSNTSGVNSVNIYTSLQDKLDLGLVNIPEILRSAPRTLTQAQIYTINEIIKNRSKTISFRAKAPTNSDTFALIPIKYGNMTTGQLYTELSGQFQDNKRVYFGPVDIDRLRIRLLDDRGNTVDLHGADWCVTLISENLYQY